MEFLVQNEVAIIRLVEGGCGGRVVNGVLLPYILNKTLFKPDSMEGVERREGVSTNTSSSLIFNRWTAKSSYHKILLNGSCLQSNTLAYSTRLKTSRKACSRTATKLGIVWEARKGKGERRGGRENKSCPEINFWRRFLTWRRDKKRRKKKIIKY